MDADVSRCTVQQWLDKIRTCDCGAHGCRVVYLLTGIGSPPVNLSYTAIVPKLEAVWLGREMIIGEGGAPRLCQLTVCHVVEHRVGGL
jgi:hypothetical protein